MMRITRHPFLWGVAVWACGHLLVNGRRPSFILFGSLLVLAIFGTYSIDAKRTRALGDTLGGLRGQDLQHPLRRRHPGSPNLQAWRDLVAAGCGHRGVGGGALAAPLLHWRRPPTRLTQGEVHRRLGVDFGGVEHRDRQVGRLQQQAELGAAEDDPVNAVAALRALSTIATIASLDASLKRPCTSSS